jgi:hypothetical protein
MYIIIRFYANGKRRIMDTGLTLEEAQAHCSRPDTSGKTRSGVRWFDGYERA